ncbi:hypothetical protein BTVI_113925 [Pitangus sulphuratus]|nr:hypothetical protein BTVI_113925 [Pitangus sulphuratus]
MALQRGGFLQEASNQVVAGGSAGEMLQLVALLWPALTGPHLSCDNDNLNSSFYHVFGCPDPALGLLELNETHFSSLSTFHPSVVATAPLSYVICKLTEGALDFSVCVTNEDFEEHWSQDRALSDTTHHRPPPSYRAIDQNSGCVQDELMLFDQVIAV